MGTRQTLSEKEQYHRQIFHQVRRYRILFIIFAVLFALLILQLCRLQIFMAPQYKQEALKNRSQASVLFNRGRILDRNGVILAQDSVLYDVFAHPRYYYESVPRETAAKLAPYLGMSVDAVHRKLMLPYDTISLKKNISKTTALKIQSLELAGVDVSRKTIRRYPQGHLASHVLGYVNDDASISTGIEKTAEKKLRTAPDLPRFERTGRNDFIDIHAMPAELVVRLPKAEDVQLTIDSRIQFAAESALAKGLKEHKAKRGAAVVMNPRTGEILAYAVLPDFNPEQFYKAQPEQLKNWSITDVYPPGSTFKIITIASGLETGVINRNSRLYDTGFVNMGGFTIKNYDYSQHGAPGSIDLIYLFQHSSNVGSLLVSLMMDPVDHHALLRKFGMGRKTGIDIPGESSGILHPPKYWDELTHATIGYGYGLASTPIQMAAAIASIANDGVWVTPHLLQDASHITRRRVISSQTAQTVTELLAESIETAQTSTVRLDGFRLAGKTGTSRKPLENGKGYSSELFTSFVGYFPAEDPRVLMMVVVDSPSTGNAWGSTVAGPIFKDIATQTIGYLGLQPNPALIRTPKKAG